MVGGRLESVAGRVQGTEEGGCDVEFQPEIIGVRDKLLQWE